MSLWKEPQVAVPRPGVNGYPIGALPPGGRGRGRKKEREKEREREREAAATAAALASRTGDSTPDEDIVSSPISRPGSAADEKFRIRLKTSLFDSVVRESTVRRSPRGPAPVQYYRDMPLEGDGSSADESEVPTVKPEASQKSTPRAELEHRQLQTGSPDGHPNNSHGVGSNGGSGLSNGGPGLSNGAASVKRLSPAPKAKRSAPMSHSPKVKRTKVSVKQRAAAASNPFGFGAAHPEDLSGQTRSAALPEGDPSRSNNDYCSTCGGVGKFLCCETCPRSFHFTCVDPPVEEDSLPDGEWHCTECRTLRHPPQPYANGLFAPLLNLLSRRNPVQFALPRGIRDRYVGVVANAAGEYETEPTNPAVVAALKKAARHINHGVGAGGGGGGGGGGGSGAGSGAAAAADAYDDSYKLIDKTDSPILCYRCGLSALQPSTLLTCEDCGLNFHAECVAEPQITIGSRWRCPNHADLAAPLPRRPRNAIVRDPQLSRGFINNGVIEVLTAEDMEATARFQQVVPPFDLYDTESGVAASRAVPKTFTVDDIVYRLPETAIKLDFIEAVHNDLADPYPETNATSVLVALDELASRDLPEREAVRQLSHLQAQGSLDLTMASIHKSLSTLLDAALASTCASPDPSQLLAVQQLMMVKGKDALLKFLTND